MPDHVLIVYSPDSQGPGSQPIDAYGPGNSAQLEEAGHLLCDGSSGWTFIVLPEPVWRMVSTLPLQAPEWGAL